MPEPIDEFPSGATGHHWKYDWTKWVDGRVWKFTRAELHDAYGVKPASFVEAARAEARRRGKRIRSRQLDNGEAIGIQFIEWRPQ